MVTCRKINRQCIRCAEANDSCTYPRRLAQLGSRKPTATNHDRACVRAMKGPPIF
jgi:hypothetical protein